MRLVMGCDKMRSLHTTTRILRVYRETLTGFSHLHSLDGLSNAELSQGCVLGQLIMWEQ